jgi:hypothetical protein
MRKPIAFTMLIAAVLLTSCAWRHDLTDRADLSGVFQREYGVELPERVAEIRGRDVGVGDTWSLWLRFSYDAETVQRIVQRGGFLQARPEEIDGGDLWSGALNSPSPNRPEWWRTPSSKRVTVYYRKSHPRDHAGFAFLWVDENAQMVYAQSSAWR